MPTNGGGGSSFKKLTEGRANGPIKTILTGSIIADAVLFQTIFESDPVWSKESGGLGKPLGPVVPKSEVVINRKANPQIMKRKINFFLEIFILLKTYPKISRANRQRAKYHKQTAPKSCQKNCDFHNCTPLIFNFSSCVWLPSRISEL